MITYAVLPLRLRRAVRRRDRGDRVARRPRRATCASRRCGSRRSARRSTAGRRGTSSTTSRRWRCATPARSCGTRTDLKPSDVQLLEAYDGFCFITLCWLEALGFCGKGESGPFIEGGERIARDGQLPLNTHGGQLSAGRLHGYGFLHEAACSCGARRATARCRADPRSRSPRPVAATPAAACSSCASSRRRPEPGGSFTAPTRPRTLDSARRSVRTRPPAASAARGKCGRPPGAISR